VTGRRTDRGSITPLILGCFLIAFGMTAGSVAVTDAFLQQQDLQSVCDSAAAAVAASAADLDRSTELDNQAVGFANVDAALRAFTARDPTRQPLSYHARLADRGRTVELTCTRTTTIAFGWVFNHRTVDQRARSAARSPLQT
jgi:Flp pilus assembly protein TadG